MTDSTAIEVVEGEFVQLGTVRAAGPTGVIEQASSVARCLGNIVDERHLYTNISGKKFVRVEGWTTLGAMLGILPREVSVIKITPDNGHGEGYEAYVELIRVNDGRVIGGASAICTRDERNWKTRDDYAVRSMAITRATGKAFRLGFSWIMTLAGYEPTPAEEMDSSNVSAQEEVAARTKWERYYAKQCAEAQSLGLETGALPDNGNAMIEEIKKAAKDLAEQVQRAKLLKRWHELWDKAKVLRIEVEGITDDTPNDEIERRGKELAAKIAEAEAQIPTEQEALL